MKNLILIGAGGHAKSCIDVIEKLKIYNSISLIDKEEKVGDNLLGYPIVDTDENISRYISDKNEFLITLGQIKSAVRRKQLFENVKILGGKFATIIASDAYVSRNAKIGTGTIIMHGAFVNAGVEIGDNCIINTKALLEHDVKIQNNCHVSTGAILNGEVQLGSESFVGSNATIIQGVTIPFQSFIKAGSLVK